VSAHGVAGNIGWAAAPVCMAAIATAAGWRFAAVAAASLGIVALGCVVLLRGSLAVPASTHSHAAADAPAASSPFAFLRVGAVWMCFVFFFASMMGLSGLQNFAPSVLNHVYGLPLTAAASALTVFLLGGAMGIAAGGFLAARFEAHERVVAVLLVSAALLALALATGSVLHAAFRRPRSAGCDRSSAIRRCAACSSTSRTAGSKRSAAIPRIPTAVAFSASAATRPARSSATPSGCFIPCAGLREVGHGSGRPG